MTTHERIEMNPEIMGGKPVIRGTRVPVEIILRKLGAHSRLEAVAEAARLGVITLEAWSRDRSAPRQKAVE